MMGSGVRVPPSASWLERRGALVPWMTPNDAALSAAPDRDFEPHVEHFVDDVQRERPDLYDGRGVTRREERPLPEDLFRARLGEPHHYAYVVDDIEATVKRLVDQLGAGPFLLIENVPLENVLSRGEPAEFVHNAAFGSCDGSAIELIEVVNLAPERVESGFSGARPRIQHVGYVVPATEVADLRSSLDERGVTQYLSSRLGEVETTLHDASATLRDPCRQPRTPRLLLDGERRCRGLGWLGTAAPGRELIAAFPREHRLAIAPVSGGQRGVVAGRRAVRVPGAAGARVPRQRRHRLLRLALVGLRAPGLRGPGRDEAVVPHPDRPGRGVGRAPAAGLERCPLAGRRGGGPARQLGRHGAACGVRRHPRRRGLRHGHRLRLPLAWPEGGRHHRPRPARDGAGHPGDLARAPDRRAARR